MDYVKEFVISKSVIYIVIRTNTYRKTFAHVSQMVAEAKKDFPDIIDDDIYIRMYNNNRYARTLGIEFAVAAETSLPTGYQQRDQLAYTFG